MTHTTTRLILAAVIAAALLALTRPLHAHPIPDPPPAPDPAPIRVATHLELAPGAHLFAVHTTTNSPVPYWLANQTTAPSDWSFFAWLYLARASTTLGGSTNPERGIVSLGGGFDHTFELSIASSTDDIPSNTITARAFQPSPAPPVIAAASSSIPDPFNARWTLVAVSWHAQSRTLSVFARNDLVSLSHTSSPAPSPVPDTTPNFSRLSLGNLASDPAASLSRATPEGPLDRALVSAWIFRNAAIDQSLFNALYDSRLPFAAYDGPHNSPLARPDALTRHAYMIGFAPLPAPEGDRISPLATLLSADPALALVTSRPNQPHSANRLSVIDTTRPQPLSWNHVRAGWAASSPQAVRYTDDDPQPDFWSTSLPNHSPPASIGYVTGRAPAVKHLADASPTSRELILFTANSRGEGRSGPVAPDPEAPFMLTYPNNIAHGFIAERKHLVLGIANRTPLTASGIDSFKAWFALDGNDTPAVYASRADRLLPTFDLHLTPAYRDFHRFWNTPNSTLILASFDQTRYCMRAAAEPGSLFQDQLPWTFRVHYLKYPGGARFRWRDNHADERNTVGINRTPFSAPINSNTSIATHTFSTALGDAYAPAPTPTLTLTNAQALAPLLLPGHAITNTSDTLARSIAVIRSIAPLAPDNSLTITLAHPFHTAPADNHTLAFGPWSIGTIQYTSAPRAKNDPARRGPEFDVIARSGHELALVLLAYDVWAETETPGFILGTMGWGGNGWSKQIEADDNGQLHNGVYQQLLDALNPDAVVLFNAVNSASDRLAHFFLFRDTLLRAKPSLPLFLVGDPEYYTASALNLAQSGLDAEGPGAIEWAEHVLSQSDHPACSILKSPVIGDWKHQYARGFRTDDPHLSHDGWRAVARAALPLMQLAAQDTTPCIADWDRNDTVNSADVGAYLTAYFIDLAEGSTIADINDSGRTDAADVGAFLTLWFLNCNP